jgi:hypothetical protein
VSNLFSFWPGLLVFVGSVGFVNISDWVEKRPSTQTIWVSAFGLLMGVYSTINGLFHIVVDWTFVNLLMPAASGGHIHGPRDAIAVLLIGLWPFVCVMAGISSAFIAYKLITRAK